MPLANLSERFYQKFGHDLVEELVSWLNQMDTTYRTDLRELNELNFARFDAKLEQRASELDAKIDQVANRLDAKIEQRGAQLDAKLEQHVARLDAKIEQCKVQLEARFDRGLANQRADLIKWMFVFWAGNVATLLALFQFFRP